MTTDTPASPDRRHEALVFVASELTVDAGLVDALVAALDVGLAVAFVGLDLPADIADIAARRDDRGSVLLVASSDAAVRTIVEGGEARTDACGAAADDALGWVRRQLSSRGIDPSATLTVALDPPAADAARSVLLGQAALRRAGHLPVIAPAADWGFVLDGLDSEREPQWSALTVLADGRVGISGAPVAGDPTARPWSVMSGVYDGEGPETHLLTGPVATLLPWQLDAHDGLRRTLDLRAGVLHERVETEAGPVTSIRFASLRRPGTVVLRASCPVAPHGPPLVPPDGASADVGEEDGVHWMAVSATSGGIVAAATDAVTPAEDGVVVDRIAAYDGDAEDRPDPGAVVAGARALAARGFDLLLAEHRAAWAARWDDADVGIDGDGEVQLGLRFALFHLMASVADEGEAAVGARGLTGPGYRGHVFWDSDTFVLPFLAATHPPAARAMLEYRLRRLDVALEIARGRGRRGARFPWESARSGHDVTPQSARDRTGRLVPVRTGLLQEHVVAEVAWAACCYVDWTGDEEFARGPGLELLVQTARYWASRVRVDASGAAHIYGVIGPDEYHEPVDDNAFTNVMARWNLRRAAEEASAAGLPELVSSEEVQAWHRVADALVDRYDATTGVYEQFAGFNELEPLYIAEVAPRRPIAADLLLGRDRVRGAQVLKQADVLMLHHLVPDEVVPGSLRPNLEFYEPRTAHGSSLSPAIHASLAMRAGDDEAALASLRMATRIDLDDLTGTTAGGLHLATMGGLWQALAFGFVGLRPRGGRLSVDPRLPRSWTGLRLTVRFHGSRVRVRTGRDELHLRADHPTDVLVGGTAATVDSAGAGFRRAGEHWEPIT